MQKSGAPQQQKQAALIKTVADQQALLGQFRNVTVSANAQPEKHSRQVTVKTTGMKQPNMLEFMSF